MFGVFFTRKEQSHLPLLAIPHPAFSSCFDDADFDSDSQLYFSVEKLSGGKKANPHLKKRVDSY